MMLVMNNSLDELLTSRLDKANKKVSKTKDRSVEFMKA